MTAVSATFTLDGQLRVQVATVGEQAGITIIGDNGSVQFVGTYQDLLQLVVDADTELNREREQRGDNSG